MSADEVYERGIAIREEMLGPEHGRAKVEGVGEFTRPFEELVTKYCFAETWGRREELSWRDRSMVTFAMLVALGRSAEVRIHAEGAIANGVTKEELREVLLQAAIYCGVPASLDGFRNTSQVLDKLGLA